MVGRFGCVMGLLVGLTGCESGLAAVVDIEVDADVARAFDADGPGLLVTDAGGTVEPVAPLCGKVLEPLTFVKDFGFGCLEDGQKGTTETLGAWVQPMPEGWDALAFCALEPSPYDALVIPPEVSGVAAEVSTTSPTSPEPSPSELAPEPAADWPQGTTLAEWHKVPICGGTLRGDPIVVSAP